MAQQTHANHHADAMDIFGFWIYVMTDCILFATLFISYVALRDATFGGPRLSELVSMPYVLAETLFLLASSFSYGLAILALYKRHQRAVLRWLGVTFLLGLSFVAMELNEFIHLIQEGHGFSANAAMSAFFTLVGTHGLHVSMGLLWMLVLMIQVSWFGLNATMSKRLTYLGLFWAFLDIVWIFVFTIVYLMGAI